MELQEIRRGIFEAVKKVRKEKPLVPSITNTVTIQFVANAQLAAGGSAAMVYLPDEGEAMAEAGNSFYINLGTMSPIYGESIPRTVEQLCSTQTPWVLDPVGIGFGKLRTKLFGDMKQKTPSIIRCNASEAVLLAKLWGLGRKSKNKICGVDSVLSVQEAEGAARCLAEWIGGAVAVSGEVDFVTDGTHGFYLHGGSELMTKVTGAGCSLGGVTAVFAAAANPLIAALTAVSLYNLAGSRAEKKVMGPGSFQSSFLDEVYLASAEDIAENALEMVEYGEVIKNEYA